MPTYIDHDSFVAGYAKDRQTYAHIETAPRTMFTTPGTVAVTPKLLMYSVARTDMTRILATHFAMPGRFIANGTRFVSAMEWSTRSWRSMAAKLVDNSVMLLPCDRPSGEYDTQWFRANVVGSFVLVTCQEDGVEFPTTNNQTVVGIGVVTAEPFANTWDPRLRLRGGNLDDFESFVDANKLLLPIHMLSCELADLASIKDVLAREIDPDMYHFDLAPRNTHSSLPSPLEFLSTDVRRSLGWAGHAPDDIPMKEFYMAHVARLLLDHAKTKVDSVDMTKKHAATAALHAIALPNLAAQPLCGNINRLFVTKLKDFNKILKLYATNIKKLGLYSDDDAVAQNHEASK